MAKFIEITVQTMPTRTETISTDNIYSAKADGNHTLIVLKEVVNGSNRIVKDLNCPYSAFRIKAGMF